MNSTLQRAAVSALVEEAVSGGARQASACAVLGFSERTFQRWCLDDGGLDGRSLRHDAPVHKLSSVERAELLAVANSAEFGHLPPSQIVPRLADQNRYIASESTFYRVLRAEHQLAHRRPERISQKRSKPRALAATAPNQLYSWDITYLPTQVRGLYFYLYLFVDVFSRKIIAWQVYAEENGDHASEIVRDLIWHERIAPGQITLHSDNGGPMKGATMLATLQTLGVMTSLSRPSVSNDNPYSESLFKTLKYRPDYPLQPFVDLAAARAWVTTLAHWYNHEHRHSAIRFVTPSQRHAGLDASLLAQRHALYEGARVKNPLRWKRHTRNWRRVDIVHLNPEKKTENSQCSASDTQTEQRTVVKPQMRQVA